MQKGRQRLASAAARESDLQNRASGALQGHLDHAGPRAFAFTEAMPLSMALAEAYISLLPMIWPLGAFRAKKGSPFFEVFRPQLAAVPAFFLTDSIPAWALALSV